MAFSADNKYLLTQTGASKSGKHDWTLIYWQWDKARPLATMTVSNEKSASIYECSFNPTDSTMARHSAPRRGTRPAALGSGRGRAMRIGCGPSAGRDATGGFRSHLRAEPQPAPQRHEHCVWSETCRESCMRIHSSHPMARFGQWECGLVAGRRRGGDFIFSCLGGVSCARASWGQRQSL